jgi:acetyl-CoA/propionyl-CoA carboxylase carboxyl transferase subunit
MAARMLSPAAEQAIAATRPKADKTNDPRNPIKRLETFFDDGTLELITAEDASGVLCGLGLARGTPVVAFASDATIQGGAMGADGCKAILVAYERALVDKVPIVGI